MIILQPFNSDLIISDEALANCGGTLVKYHGDIPPEVRIAPPCKTPNGTIVIPIQDVVVDIEYLQKLG
jgi:hypothetical protein